MEAQPQQSGWGTRRSLALLFSRILMSTLFVYVGVGEIQRQLEVCWAAAKSAVGCWVPHRLLDVLDQPFFSIKSRHV
jgi:hypothetical protein